MANNPGVDTNLGDQTGGDMGGETAPTLMERWETKHTLVVVGVLILIYVAYKQLKS